MTSWRAPLTKKRSQGGKLETGQDEVDPIVVDGIEGFSGVKEKKKTVNLLLNTFIEEGVDVSSVITT